MSRFRTFGQGNGPTRAKTIRANKRIREHVIVTDDRDVGVRPDAIKLFGRDGEELEGPPEHDVSWCEVGFGCPQCVAGIERRAG
jgi:hypothetical protein